MAVCVADILRFPEKSILVLEGMPQKFRKFYALYSHIHFSTIRPDKESKDNESWLCEISLKELDPLWTWFETTDDVLFGVSFLLARVNVENIDQELIKLRPSSGLQRLPSVYEPNQGYMSPRISSPSIAGSRALQNKSMSESSQRSTLNPKTGSSQEEQNTTRKRTSLVPEHRRESTIKEEGEEQEEEDEPSVLLVAERTRRPCNGSPSQQQVKKAPEQRTIPPPKTRGSSYYDPFAQQEARRVPEQRTAPPPRTGERPYVPYVPPRTPRRHGAQSTQSMLERRTPEETEDLPANDHGYQRASKYKRMSTHHEAEESSESSGEEAQEMKITKKPGVTIHQSLHLEVPEESRDKNHARFQAAPASMPDYLYPRTASAPDYEYPRTNNSYTPNPGFSSRFDSVSGRRHSERSRPARHYENR